MTLRSSPWALLLVLTGCGSSSAANITNEDSGVDSAASAEAGSRDGAGVPADSTARDGNTLDDATAPRDALAETGSPPGDAAIDAGSGTETGAKEGGDANPPGCPAYYGADGGDCPTSSACRYSEGLCDCESSHCGGALLPDASFHSVWTCTMLDPSCPPGVTSGGSCTPGVKCSYGYCCAPTIECSTGGTWQMGVGFCPP